MTPKLITTTQVADMLNMTPRRLRDWRLAGVGPTYEKRDGSGRVLYHYDSVMAFIKDSEVTHCIINNRIHESFKASKKLTKKPSRHSDYVRKASQMYTPFKYDIGFDSYTKDYDYEDKARCYNDKAQNC